MNAHSAGGERDIQAIVHDYARPASSLRRNLDSGSRNPQQLTRGNMLFADLYAIYAGLKSRGNPFEQKFVALRRG